VSERDLTGQLVGDSDEPPEPTKYVRNQEAKARQAERIALLTREGYTVVQGGCGLTVFRWGRE
jgi:hypothetical protein